jgi:hypothetical protein
VARTTPKKDRADEVKKLVAEIDMGRLDQWSGELFNALRRRMGEQMVGLPWWVTLPDGHCFGIDDMSLSALVMAESESGRSWHVLHPETSAREYRALVAAHCIEDRGWSEAQTIELLRSIKDMSAIKDSITFSVVTPDPFVASGT